MNVAQLHSVCIELQKEISETDILRQLQELEEALQQSINQPNQPDPQQKIGELRNKIIATLTAIESQERSIVKRQIIDEIGGTRLVGGHLLQRINNSFSQVDVTPSLVQKDISTLREEIQEFSGGLDSLIEGFQTFDLGADELPTYVAELGVVIPRREGKESLAFFSRDLVKLNHELQAFVELVTGGAEELRVRSISSSDLSVFIELLPRIAQQIVSVIALLLLGYEKLLDIRKKRKELRDQDAPSHIIDGMDEWAESLMEEKIDEITVKLIEKYKDVERPDGRAHELRGSVRMSVKKMAGRIDVGYQFSARIGEPAAESADEEGEEGSGEQEAEITRQLREDASKIERRELPGDPVLPISWRPDGNDEDGGNGQS